MKKLVLFLLFSFLGIITDAQPKPVNGKSKLVSDSSVKKKGFISDGVFEAGYVKGTGTQYYHYNSVKILFSVNLFHAGKDSENPFFAIGLGTGFKYYIMGFGSAFIPFFANFQLYFFPKKVTPYLFVSPGYTFSTAYHFERVGPLLQSEVGIKIKTGIDNRWLIGMGYEYQFIAPFASSHGIDRFVPGLSFNIGLLF